MRKKCLHDIHIQLQVPSSVEFKICNVQCSHSPTLLQEFANRSGEIRGQIAKVDDDDDDDNDDDDDDDDE